MHFITGHVDRVRKGALRTTGQSSEHLASLVRVIVNGLLAKNDEAGLFFVHDLRKDLGNRERLDIFSNDEDRAVSTHGERRTQRFLRLVRSDRHCDDFGRNALFTQTQRFFHRDFVKRVHAHFDIRQINTRTIGLNPRLNIIIDDPLNGDDDLHLLILPYRLKWRVNARLNWSAYA